MRTLILQHSDADLPATLKEWLEREKLFFENHRVHQHPEMPDPSRFDWLVILGGKMNVDEEEAHPWLKMEKRFLAHWLEEGKAVLGICLGGQLLAQALGAKVTKNKAREIGFHDVVRTGEAHPAFAHWPERMKVFQFHQDRFSLPDGCRALLTSEICQYQAFALDDKTVGLQFHPESTEEWIVKTYKEADKQESEVFVQTPEACFADLPDYLPGLTQQFFTLLTEFRRCAAASLKKR